MNLRLSILSYKMLQLNPITPSLSLSLSIPLIPSEAFSEPVFVTGPDRNGFNVGLKRNLEQVFGEDKRLWFIPVCTR